jgi:hypothetical protein
MRCLAYQIRFVNRRSPCTTHLSSCQRVAKRIQLDLADRGPGRQVTGLPLSEACPLLPWMALPGDRSVASMYSPSSQLKDQPDRVFSPAGKKSMHTYQIKTSTNTIVNSSPTERSRSGRSLAWSAWHSCFLLGSRNTASKPGLNPHDWLWQYSATLSNGPLEGRAAGTRAA